MLYSDYYTEQDGSQTAHPTIDYQLGSVRDDFDFGSILLFRTDVLKKVISEMDTEYNFAALYDLRLRLSREGLIHQYMDEARQEFGARASENVRVMRNRSRKGRYDSRL